MNSKELSVLVVLVVLGSYLFWRVVVPSVVWLIRKIIDDIERAIK